MNFAHVTDAAESHFPGVSEFTDSYFESLYFTDTGEPEQPDAGADLSPALELQSRADCLAFWSRIAPYMAVTDASPAQAGHDFWLTRNGHGAGFWDRGDIYRAKEESEITGARFDYSDMFTKRAEAAGTVETFANDSGEIDA